MIAVSHIAKSIKIGNEIIYPEQRRTAQQLISVLTDRDYSAFLDAECQQGKTGVCIAVVDAKLKRAIKQRKSLHVIVCIAESKNGLRDQTELDFDCYWNHKGEPAGAKLQAKFLEASEKVGKQDFYKLTIVHRSQLRNLVLHDCDWRLFILDECHIAEVKPKDGGELNAFYARMGIDISKCPRDWKRGKTTNYLLAVSATGFSWLLAAHKLGTFKPVLMERSPFYMGLIEMEAQDRFLNLESPIMVKVAGEWVVSNQFKMEILPRFLRECKWHKAGYCLTRLQGKSLAAFKTWLCDNGYPWREATMASGEIQNIMSILEEKPSKPTFLLISGIFRAGMRIVDDSNIRMIIEPTGMNGEKGVDALIQSMVGRSMGHNKTNPYPIYCSRAKLDEALAYLTARRKMGPEHVEALGVLPKSKNMRSNVRVGGKRWHYIWHATNPEPERNPRRQSKNSMDFTQMIKEGTERTSHPRTDGEVYEIDSLVRGGRPTSEGYGKPVAYDDVRFGFYVRGPERDSSEHLDFVEGAPHITSPQVH